MELGIVKKDFVLPKMFSPVVVSKTLAYGVSRYSLIKK